MTRTGEWLSKAWEMVTGKGNFWAFVLIAFLYSAVLWGIGAFTGGLSGIVLNGPATAAVYAVILHLMKTNRLDANRLEDGFRAFLPAMLVGLLVWIFTILGFAFCIVPGIIIGALYLFPLLLVIDRKMSFWDAMEESRKKVQQDLIGFMGFFLALIGINILGALALGVGVFVSQPITWCATVIAYRELWPEQETVITPPAPAGPDEDPPSASPEQ